MSNPYPQLPRDTGSEAMQGFPAPKLALEQYTNENATASSVISVTHDTTMIEVAAVGGTAAIRWVPRTETAAVAPAASIITIAGSTANYDHIVPSGSFRRFAIPIEVQGSYQSVQGINRSAGLYQRVALKSIGVASVLLSEY